MRMTGNKEGGGRQEPWRQQRGWCATNRVMEIATKAMATRAAGKQR
jgi:hypothetical protein